MVSSRKRNTNKPSGGATCRGKEGKIVERKKL